VSTTPAPILRVEGKVAPLPADDVDTDQIIPASYLKVTDKSGLAEGLFANWRAEESARGGVFVLDRPERRDATILLAGNNFGCGSSREHAAWALQGAGVRAVVSTRFADIFRSNALKNGLLAVEIDAAPHAALMARAEADPELRLAIDLERRVVEAPGGEPVPFRIDAFARTCLLQGVDQLGYLLEQLPAIAAWEAAQPTGIDTRSG
jgi:3-isopropylmalate/(R)-2-methylmalate dehydratase small subunit